MPGLTSAWRTSLLHFRSILAWHLLGTFPFLDIPIPQSIRGFSTKVLLRLISNADARLFVIEQLPQHLRSQLVERVLTSDPCEQFFAMLVNLCGYMPDPEALASSLTTIRFGAAVLAKPTETRLFTLPRRRSNVWYGDAEGEDQGGQWNNAQFKVASAADLATAAEAPYFQAIGSKADTVAAPKEKALREKGNYKK